MTDVLVPPLSPEQLAALYSPAHTDTLAAGFGPDAMMADVRIGSRAGVRYALGRTLNRNSSFGMRLARPLVQRY